MWFDDDFLRVHVKKSSGAGIFGLKQKISTVGDREWVLYPFFMFFDPEALESRFNVQPKQEFLSEGCLNGLRACLEAEARVMEEALQKHLEEARSSLKRKCGDMD